MNRIILEALKCAMLETTYTPKAPMVVVDDVDSLDEWRTNWKVLPTWLGVDTETIGLNAHATYTTLGGVEIEHPITVIQYFDGLTNYVINVPKLYQKGLHDELFDFIKPIHESEDIQKAFFNAVFDIKMLWSAGVFTENVVCLMLGAKLSDSDSGRFNPSLKGIAKNWFGYDMDKSVRATFLTKEVRDGVFTDEQLKYAGDDVEILAPLYRKVYHDMAKSGQLDGWAVTNYSLQGVAFFELGGVPVDYDELMQLVEMDNKEYSDLLARKADLGLAPYNLNSNDQVKDIYKNLLGIELVDARKETIKKYSKVNEITKYIYDVRTHSKKAAEKVDKTFLAPQHKNKYIPRNYTNAFSNLDYLYNTSNRRAIKRQFGHISTKTEINKFRKQLSVAIRVCWINKGGEYNKYADIIYNYHMKNKITNFVNIDLPGMDHTNNFYLWQTNINPEGARTGRLSSNKSIRLANLHNIQSYIRAATRVPKGWVCCSADYTAIEVLIAAQLANEQGIIKTINEGLDVHKYSAAMMFEVDYDEVTPKQRKTVKAIVFLVLYGGTVYALAESLGVDIKKAQELYNKYFDTFPNFKDFVESRVNEARYSGNIRLTSGAYRPLGINSKAYSYKLRGSIQRESKNAAMQGACAVIIKRAGGMMAREIHKRGWVDIAISLIPVHDEMGLMVPKHLEKEAKALVSEVMDKAAKEALPDINRPVKVDVARHWSKESYRDTLLNFANGNTNENDTEEVVVMCFGTHTLEYKFWNEYKLQKNFISEFFNTIETARYDKGTLPHNLREKLI
jgi:DNA polymerase I-like protein with 3'-5' exonuclease and polymerase domains